MIVVFLLSLNIERTNSNFANDLNKKKLINNKN